MTDQETEVELNQKDAVENHDNSASDATTGLKGQNLDQTNVLPFSFAKRAAVVVDPDHQPLKMFISEQTTLTAIAEAHRQVGFELKIETITEEALNQRLNEVYQNRTSDTMQAVEGIGDELDLTSLADSVSETEDLMDQQDDAPIIRLINAILTESVKENASDIHIETFEKDLVVRFRIDGMLREVLKPRRALAPLLTSRIKVMAKLDIAEKRIPQDGRIALRVAGREVDIRVSTLPSSHGERIVMRLLDKQAGRLDLTHLGMGAKDLEVMKRLIERPHGIILVTGPTGSGKTTTLYASIQSLNTNDRNILTVEDPVEYTLPGIGQTQVNNKADMTFAKGLRAILRQDPDVVMIGEVRDGETVEIAVQASLTGHLVLSTLHTNSAVGAMTRLQDMGIEPFLLSSSLIGVLAQRLVRTLCPHCKTPHTATELECNVLGVDAKQPPTLHMPNGCEECGGTGYKGRMGVYELIEIDSTLQQMIHDGKGELEMETYARTKGSSIQQDGLSKVLDGKTTLEEVMRVCRAQ